MLGIFVVFMWATVAKSLDMSVDAFGIYTAICMVAMVLGFKD